MKRIIFLALIILVFSISLSYGEVQEFRKFTMDIPENWNTNEEGNTVNIIKNDNAASINVTISSIGLFTLEQLAETFRESFKGSEISQNENGSYKFTFDNANGLALVASNGEEYILIVVNGLSNASEEIINILSTLKDK